MHSQKAVGDKCTDYIGGKDASERKFSSELWNGELWLFHCSGRHFNIMSLVQETFSLFCAIKWGVRNISGMMLLAFEQSSNFTANNSANISSITESLMRL